MLGFSSARERFPTSGKPQKLESASSLPSIVRSSAIAIGFFVAAFLVHWLVWRVRIPSRQTLALLAIFSATLVIGLFTSAFWSEEWRLTSIWELLHVTIFYVGATLSYVVAYSALEERSPSMTILSHVADSGSSGRSREELEAMMLNISPVEIRLAAMLRDGMVEEESGKILLTNKGRAWTNTFKTWRRLMRFGPGG